MRLKLFQQDIGRNFKESIWNKEDGKGDIGLIAFEVQIFGQTEGEGVGNVDTVKEGGEVDEEKNRYHAYVYLSDQGFLVDCGRTLDCDSGILLGAVD